MLKTLTAFQCHQVVTAFFFFLFFLLKNISVRSTASINFKARIMKNFRIKTHRQESTYEKPHFFILNKGLNSGKPLLEPCPNCFVCIAENESDKDFMFWLSYGLWRSGSFHYFLKGSVIPFITIGDIKKHLETYKEQALLKNGIYLKTIKSYQLLDEHENRLKNTLKLIEMARKALYHQFLHDKTVGV
jgi:hypothetical protein